MSENGIREPPPPAAPRGLPVYVSDEAPPLGDTVTVRVRTSPADPVDAICLRTAYAAEPVFHPMTPVHADAAAGPRLDVWAPSTE